MAPLDQPDFRDLRVIGVQWAEQRAGLSDSSIALERKVRQKNKSSRCLQLIEPSSQPWLLVKGHSIHTVRPSRAGYNEGLCFWAFCHSHFRLKNKSQ